MTSKIVVFFRILTAISFGQNTPHRHTYAEMVHFYDYNASVPLDVKELSSESRSGAVIHDITYASPKGGVVPAYVVEPEVSLVSCGLVFE